MSPKRIVHGVWAVLSSLFQPQSSNDIVIQREIRSTVAARVVLFGPCSTETVRKTRRFVCSMSTILASVPSIEKRRRFLEGPSAVLPPRTKVTPPRENAPSGALALLGVLQEVPEASFPSPRDRRSTLTWLLLPLRYRQPKAIRIVRPRDPSILSLEPIGSMAVARLLRSTPPCQLSVPKPSFLLGRKMLKAFQPLEGYFLFRARRCLEVTMDTLPFRVKIHIFTSINMAARFIWRILLPTMEVQAEDHQTNFIILVCPSWIRKKFS